MSAPDRPTQTQLNATLRVAEDGRGDAHDARLLAVEVRALHAEQALGRATAEAWAAIHPDSRASVSRFQPRLAEALDQLVAYVEER